MIDAMARDYCAALNRGNKAAFDRLSDDSKNDYRAFVAERLMTIEAAIPGLADLIDGTAVVMPVEAEQMFPIMKGPSVPWPLIAPYEHQALKNHGQTLKRLAERGGLSICEAMAVMSSTAYRDRPIANPTIEDWQDFISGRKVRAASRAASPYGGKHE